MRHHLSTSYGTASPIDQAWRIIEYLESEPRDFIIRKSDSERDTPEKVFSLLSRRFGTGSNRTQIRQSFLSRIQNEGESETEFLNSLESLRTQGFPQESVVSRSYEVLQRFIEGVRDEELRRNLATMYAHEHYLNEPPTVEALRYATEQYLRTRGPIRESPPIEVSNMEPLHTDIPQPELQPQATTNASGSPHAPIAQPHAPQQFAPPRTSKGLYTSNKCSSLLSLSAGRTLCEKMSKSQSSLYAQFAIPAATPNQSRCNSTTADTSVQHSF